MKQIEYQADRQYAFRFSGGGYPCPECNSKTGWSYIRNFGRDYGMCFACGYKHFPKTESVDSRDSRQEISKPNAINYIPLETVDKTLAAYHLNPFVLFLNLIFGSDKMSQILSQFKIGTAKNGGTVFWYIDKRGLFRKPKIMYYDQWGRRIKDDPYKQTHCAGYTNARGYTLPLYGEHQLNTLLYPESTPVLLVESEKSACIGYVILPQYIWLATSGSTSLNSQRAKVLQGRKIIIIPDADEAGREGAGKSQKVLQAAGIEATIADLFPGINDHTDIADHVTAFYSKLQSSYSKPQKAFGHNLPSDQLQGFETISAKYPVVTNLIEQMDLKILDVKQT